MVTCLLIFPIFFLDGFMNVIVGWLIKFFLWSFKATKGLSVSFTSILSNVSACFANLIPSFLIFGPIFSSAYKLLWWHFSKRFDNCSYSVWTYWKSCLWELVSSLISAFLSFLHTIFSESHSLLCETLILLLFLLDQTSSSTSQGFWLVEELVCHL